MRSKARPDEQHVEHPSYISGLRPVVPRPKPARTYVGAEIDTLELDEIDTAVETVSAVLVAQSRATDDDEPATFVDPIAIEDEIRAAQAAGLPSPAPDAPKLAPPRFTVPPPEPPFVVGASVTPMPGIVFASDTTGARRFAVNARVHLPPPVVRRAFIASMQPLPPPRPPIRPLAIVAGVFLGALGIIAASLAVLTFLH